MGFPGNSVGQESTCSAGDLGQESACSAGDLGQEDPLEKKMATHSRILTWKIL